jgi:tetratricopeptide (TPR) repeat protein
MSAMRGAHALLLLPLAGLALLPAAAPPAGDDTGFRRFREQQVGAAKAAVRAKDWAKAEAAWSALLELDPRSLDALDGLAEVGKLAGDRDAELLARVELNGPLAAAVAAGETSRERDLARSIERLAQLDPAPGEADQLMAAYAAAQAELARHYVEGGFVANALAAWQRAELAAHPGSAEALAAQAGLAQTLASAPDEVAQRFDAVAAPGGPDAAWIAEHDRKTAKWSQAARWETPHYRIKTTAGWRIGTEVASSMERVQAFYREIWGLIPDPPPEHPSPELRNLAVTPLDINIYGTLKEYRTRAGEGAQDWSAGNYNGSELNTYNPVSEGGKGTRSLMTTLFHEASHQFMHVAVGDVPSFVNEGVASLFEGIEVLSNGSIRRDLPVPGRLVPLAEKLEKGTAMPLRDVFNARENKPELYDYRWGVMYFLRMYVDATGNYVFRARLQDYIYEFKKGSPGDMVEHFTHFVLEQVKAPEIDTFDRFEAIWKQWIINLAAELKTADKRLEEYDAKGRMASMKDEPDVALRWFEKALDVDADDLEALWGTGEVCTKLAQAAGEGPVATALRDRALLAFRRFADLAPEEEERRSKAVERANALDPQKAAFADARRELAGGMAALARKYDEEQLPRMAMLCARSVLAVEPFDPSARALLTRLERDTGLSIVRWQRLFNGFDLDGWYSAEGSGSFFVDGGTLLNDSARVAAIRDKKKGDDGAGDAGAAPAEDEGITYQALLLDRKVDGDFTLQARIQTGADWKITGLIFGARDTDHYEAIVLRNRPGDEKGPGGKALNNVDFGSYDSGAWTFRGDGSIKAEYDAAAGVVLRLDVRGRAVAVSIDGTPVTPIVGGQFAKSIKYPQGALRGDVGLLGSHGVTRYTDIRLRAGDER